MISSISDFPKEQLITQIRSKQPRFQQFIQEISNLNINWIYETIAHIYNFIAESKQSPQTKFNAMKLSKQIIETCQIPCINLIQVYLVPILYWIASYQPQQLGGRRGYRYFMDEGYSFRISNIEEIGIQFVRLASQILYISSIIKTKRLIDNEELEQESVCVELYNKFQEINQQGQIFKPNSMKYFELGKVSSYRKKYQQKLKKFQQKSQLYTKFIVLKMINSLQTQRNPLFSIRTKTQTSLSSDLDMKMLLKSGDTYITSPFIQEIVDGLMISEHFRVKRNYLAIFSDMIKWADIEAVLQITYEEVIDKIAVRIAEVNGNKSMQEGQKIYPEIHGQIEAKKRFYIQFLKCIQVWAKLLSDSTFDKKQQKSKMEEFYQYFKNERKFIFPDNIMLHRIKDDFKYCENKNRERNDKIFFRLKLDSNSIHNNSSLNQKSMKQLSASINNVNTQQYKRTFESIKQQFEERLKNLTQLGDNEEELPIKIQLLFNFRQNFDKDLENLEEIPNDDQMLELLDDGDTLISSINALETFYKDYKAQVITYKQFLNLFDKRLQVLEKSNPKETIFEQNQQNNHQQSNLDSSVRKNNKNGDLFILNNSSLSVNRKSSLKEKIQSILEKSKHSQLQNQKSQLKKLSQNQKIAQPINEVRNEANGNEPFSFKYVSKAKIGDKNMNEKPKKDIYLQNQQKQLPSNNNMFQLIQTPNQINQMSKQSSQKYSAQFQEIKNDISEISGNNSTLLLNKQEPLPQKQKSYKQKQSYQFSDSSSNASNHNQKHSEQKHSEQKHSEQKHSEQKHSEQKHSEQKQSGSFMKQIDKKSLIQKQQNQVEQLKQKSNNNSDQMSKLIAEGNYGISRQSWKTESYRKQQVTFQKPLSMEGKLQSFNSDSNNNSSKIKEKQQEKVSIMLQNKYLKDQGTSQSQINNESKSSLSRNQQSNKNSVIINIKKNSKLKINPSYSRESNKSSRCRNKKQPQVRKIQNIKNQYFGVSNQSQNKIVKESNILKKQHDQYSFNPHISAQNKPMDSIKSSANFSNSQNSQFGRNVEVNVNFQRNKSLSNVSQNRNSKRVLKKINMTPILKPSSVISSSILSSSSSHSKIENPKNKISTNLNAYQPKSDNPYYASSDYKNSDTKNAITTQQFLLGNRERIKTEQSIKNAYEIKSPLASTPNLNHYGNQMKTSLYWKNKKNEANESLIRPQRHPIRSPNFKMSNIEPVEEYMTLKYRSKSQSSNNQLSNIRNRILKLQSQTFKIRNELSQRSSRSQSKQYSTKSKQLGVYSGESSRLKTHSNNSNQSTSVKMLNQNSIKNQQAMEIDANKFSQYLKQYKGDHLKKSLIKPKCLISKIKGIQFGSYVRSDYQNQLNLIIYITPEYPVVDFTHSLSNNANLQIKSYPKRYEEIKADWQVRLSLTIYMKSYPYNLPEITFKYKRQDSSLKQQIKLNLPISPHRFLKFQPITSPSAFNQQFFQDNSNILKTRQIKFNKKVLKISSLQEYFPKASLLNQKGKVIQYGMKGYLHKQQYKLKFVCKDNKYIEIYGTVANKKYINYLQFMLAAFRQTFSLQQK